MRIDGNFLNNNFFESTVKNTKNNDFSALLRNKLDEISSMGNIAEQGQSDYLNGMRDDIQNVMIDNEKANLALSLGLEVRNKLIDGYQELTKMQF